MAVTAFSYKYGNSFLHTTPSWIKILLLPIVSFSVFKFPFYFAAAFCLMQIILACILKFTVIEQLKDLKVVLYYAAFLITAKLAGAIFTQEFNDSVPDFFISFIISEKETWILLLKLLCVMQSASLLFKTSTSLQIREGLEMMEKAVRRALHLKPRTPLAEATALFICFIPQVSENWQQAERAWKIRGGKKSLRMFIVLLPVLFSVGMRQAYNTAKALSIRKGENNN